MQLIKLEGKGRPKWEYMKNRRLNEPFLYNYDVYVLAICGILHFVLTEE